VSSRNKSNPIAYYNSLSFKYGNGRGVRQPICDFHIKKSDDSAYEKIVID
jgi:hypothetical protein